MLTLDRNPGSSIASREPRSDKGLDFIWLEVTGKCNLRCVHCYAESGPQRQLHEYMTPRRWEVVLEQAAELGCRAVQFIGGEPTMYPGLAPLIERARRVGFGAVEIYTNGTMIKPRLRDTLLRHNVALAFSVYADHAQIHDEVTQQAGSFARTLESIRWALASGLSVRVGIIKMEANCAHIEQTEKLLRGIGVTNVDVDRVRAIGRGGHEEALDRQLGQLCGACVRGRLAVTASGDIFPCVFSRFWPLGHVDQGLRPVVEGLSLASFRQALRANRDLSESLNDCDPGCAPGICGPGLTDPCRPDKHCGPNPNCTPDLSCEPERPCQPFWTPGPS